MRNKKIRYVSLFVFVIMLSTLTVMRTKAESDISIISETKASVYTAKEWARSKGATEDFIELAEVYWSMSSKHGGVNPAIAYVQSAIETNYGKYTGNVPKEYLNMCGIKTQDGKEFMRFSSIEKGVSAHLDHLALYAGAIDYPRLETEDPRHFYYLNGTSKYVSTLGNSWANSTTYSDNISRLYKEIDVTGKDDLIVLNSSNIMDKDNCIISLDLLSQNVIEGIELKINDKVIGKYSILYNSSNTNSNYLNSGKSSITENINVNDFQKDSILTVTVKHSYGEDTIEKFELVMNNEILEEKADPSLKTLMIVDAPNATGIQKETKEVIVNGWALSGSGIEKIEVYLDGKLEDTIKTGISRPDVNRHYPEYYDNNSGFSCKLKLDTYLDTRVLEVKAFGTNGTVFTVKRSYNLPRLSNHVQIDDPRVGDIVVSENNVMNVKGWVKSSSKISKVSIYFDDNRYCDLNYGVHRPDVSKVFPDYRNEYMGYTGSVDLNNISGGNRKVTIRAICENGETFESTRNVNIVKKQSRMCLDSPSDNMRIENGTMSVWGWALADSGVEEVKMYINNVYKGNATYSTSRPDVNRVYPGYSSGNNCGYSANISLSGLKEGSHKFKVISVAKDGTQQSVERTFKIGKLNGKTIMIDPGHGGSDPGAMSYFSGITYREKDLNLTVSNYLKSELESMGYSVIMTRNTDTYVGLEARSTYANQKNVDFLVSIHQDSFDSSTAKGTTVFYTSKTPDKGYFALDKNYKITKSKEIATSVSNNIVNSIGTYNRGVKDQSLSVTRNTDMPSILVECGFMSNWEDCSKLSNSSYQKKIAKSIATGIDSNL